MTKSVLFDDYVSKLGLKSDDESFDIDSIDIIDIDTDDINKAAISDVDELIDSLSKFYYSDDFMQKHPSFRKRVESDMESLRILFKMRKTSERAHDILINAISSNSGNASLYRSLSDTQKTIISITSKIGDIIESLNNMMKSYQTEINFDQPTDSDNDDSQEENQKDTHRGSKDFINQMNEGDSISEESLFEDE